MREPSLGYVAECFWVGITERDLAAIDGRAATCANAESGDGQRVRYLGSILMRADEVVLCFFEGPAAAVHRTAVCAAIPFERIVETSASPWTSALRVGAPTKQPVTDQ